MAVSTKAGVASTISKIAVCACALTLVMGLTGCVFTTPARSEVKPEKVEPTLTASDLVQEGVLTVAMDPTDAPQALTDADGKPSGYYFDIARAFAERFGLKLKIVSSASASESVGKGEADLFLGSKAYDSQGELPVIGILVDNGSAIFAKTADGSNEVPTLSASNLSGASIAVQDASASQDALLRAGVDADLVICENVNKCFEALADGKAKYVACDATAGSYLARAYPGVVFAGTISAVSSYGISFSADNSALLNAVTDTYQEMLDGGIIDAIHRTWYGATPVSLVDSQLSGIVLSVNTDKDETSEDGTAEGEGGDGAGADASADGASDEELSVGEDINSLN